MNAFGIKNNRFQQKAIKKKLEIHQKHNNNPNLSQQSNISQSTQNQYDKSQNRKESITVVSPTTPILEFHVPIFEPAKFINDITHKKL